MKENNNRRSFIKKLTISGIGMTALPSFLKANGTVDEKAEEATLAAPIAENKDKRG
jgi:hypothetical protein